MNDLNTLLERAAGPTTAPVDASADLTRGHRALARTRRRRGAAGLAGVAALGVVGYGVTRLTPDPGGRTVATDDDRGPDGGTTTPSPDYGALGFLSQPLAAGPYTFPTTPRGWEVQGVVASAVTIAPVGFADREPLSFVGKLVILFDTNPPTGERVQVSGRTLWVREGEGSTVIATRTRPGEPEGVVSVQYPTDTGWSLDDMELFLAGVTVGPGAEPGVG